MPCLAADSKPSLAIVIWASFDFRFGTNLEQTQPIAGADSGEKRKQRSNDWLD
jgi:hypothetical protein